MSLHPSLPGAFAHLTPIEAKKAEIANYRRILDGYWGRWHDAGRRHLAELENQLRELEGPPAVGNTPPKP